MRMPTAKLPYRQLSHGEANRPRVLFLGYGEHETRILSALIDSRCEVHHTAEKVTAITGFDVAISFGYRHIISQAVISGSSTPIVNLHISYLPFNRGAHPNFWSFFEDTPSGVSVHLIDSGVDTGPILLQKQVFFDETERTFSQTYRRLVTEVENLFLESTEDLLTHKIRPVPQPDGGTVHRLADLPKDFAGWNSIIEDEVRRLRRLKRDK